MTRARVSLAVHLVARAGLFGLVACASAPVPWEGEGDPAAETFESLSPRAREVLLRGVAAYEVDDYATAEAAFSVAVQNAPGDIRAAIWLQEAQLASNLQRARPRGLQDQVDPAVGLRERYRELAEAEPTALAWILAARLEPDAPAARLLLERALEFDPGLAWAHYGLAHVAARAGEWSEARAQLDATFAANPGHLPALRLFAWSQAHAGDPALAIEAFEAWFERADEDLCATRADRDAATLDLALVELAFGHPERASELIESLELLGVDSIRRLGALAATWEARGDPRAALEATGAALAADPGALLPAVQEALLLELRLGDVPGARAAWHRVLEIAGEQPSLAALVQRLRADLHLARLPAEGEGRR